MLSVPDFSRLEIVHVVRQYAPRVGGLEEFVAKLAAEQLSVFRKVRVVTCDRIFKEPQVQLAKSEVLDGVQVDRLAHFGSSRYPIMPKILPSIKSADLVHVHATDFAYDALPATRFLHRKPLVVTTHGGFFHTSSYATLKKVWFHSLSRLSARGFKAIVCCSENDKKNFSRIAGDRVRLILNGVDIEKYGDAASPIPKKRVITLGRFSDNKRIDLLLDVFVQLVARDPDWNLDIFGVPFDLSEQDLTSMIAARNLQSHVTVGVGLPTSDIRHALQSSTYFMSASEYEGFGLALVEAMSAGLLPFVQSNEAYSDFAGKHEGVRLCDFSKPDQVANQLLKFHENVEEKHEECRLAVIEVARFYSWPHVAKQYLEVYREML